MTGEGTVVKTNGRYATVRIEKRSACSGECSSCGLCNNPVYDIEVINDAGAQTGDIVRLYMPTGKVYASAFLVYMLPILAVFSVMGVCSLLAVKTSITAILCVAVLAGWLWLIRTYNKKANLKSSIEEVVKQNS